MKITIIGTGYVGLVTGVCLADFGHNVICVDNNTDKINKLLKGISPIYEPGIEELIKRNLKHNRLYFTTDEKYSIESSEVIFIAVGTPSNEDGSANLDFIFEVVNTIGNYINNYKVVVTKSTVPVGTGKEIIKLINKKIKERRKKITFDYVSNPEFLREGRAIYDFTHPDRIVIGTKSEKAKKIMKEIYRVLYLNNVPFIFTNLESAELIKYASNSYLAVKISFINELAILSEKVGANIQDVAKAMGMDGRISPKFLHPGPGYGGSCLPKDTKALVELAKSREEDLLMVKAAILANEKQKRKVVEKIKVIMQYIYNKTIGVLGLTFKQETDDLRESPALYVIPELIRMGAYIRVFDPKGMENAKKIFNEDNDKITYCDNEYDVAKGSDAIVILTEWNQFRGMDLKKLRGLMKDNYFFDFRNIYWQDLFVKKYFRYFGIGL